MDYSEKVGIHVVFTSAPRSFSVKILGREVLSGPGPNDLTGRKFSSETSLRFPPEGIDLVASAAFQDATAPQEMQVELVRADGTTQSQTLTGSKEIQDVLFFSGREIHK